jgi:hypothetical protein
MDLFARAELVPATFSMSGNHMPEALMPGLSIRSICYFGVFGILQSALIVGLLY